MPKKVNKPRTAVVPYGHPHVDSIYINEVEFTDYFISFRVVKKLNQMGSFEIKLLDIRSSDQVNVQQGKIVKIFVDNNLLFKGRIETVEYGSEYECTIKGYDMSQDLLHWQIADRKDHTDGEDTNILVEYLCSENYDRNSPWIMQVGTNDVTATVYTRFEYTNRLKCLHALATHNNAEWWISNGGSGNHAFPFDTDYFNLSSSKGTGTSVHTFYLSGANQNATLCKREKDMENLVNDVTVLGYGDGVNQISATSNDSTGAHQARCATSITNYGRRQKTYVDRTLVSTTAAQAIADNIVDTQLDPIERITIQLEDVYDFVDRQTMVMKLDIGDTVTIVDDDTGLNADFKIQGIEYTNDPEYGSRMILECSEKKLTILDELEDTRKNVENIDVYMQGSTVCWNLSEKENLDANTDLDMTFYLPSDIIRINSAKLSFKIKDFRAYTSSSQTSAANSAPSPYYWQIGQVNVNIGNSWVNVDSNTMYDDTLFCLATFFANDDGTSTANLMYFRVYDGTDYYPGPEGIEMEIAQSEDGASSVVYGSILIPGNVNGKTLTLQAKQNVDETTEWDFTNGAWAGCGTHTHNLTMDFGIYEDTQTGKSIDVTVIRPDGSTSSVGTGYTSDRTNIPITSNLDYANQGPGWYTIKFSANKNARIEANCYLQFFIKSK